MSEVVPDAPQEFWRPPVVPPRSTTPAMATACGHCGTEFMVGARFCHNCGTARIPQAVNGDASWTRHLEFLRALEFQRIHDWLGLPLQSLIAFLAGIGCLLGALGVSLIYSAQNLADFQAIQLWRLQWLLAAVAAFVAGILLKRSNSPTQ